MNVTIRPEQLLYDSAVIPPAESPRLHPWQKPLPHRLYKYYPPERFHILTDCAVRFSQREVFDDQHDLRPEVENFGTAEEIRAFMDYDPTLSPLTDALKNAVIQYVLHAPNVEQRLIEQAQGQMAAATEFGVFCLCENSRSRAMWDQYAARGTGFLIAFNTRHPGFSFLRTPGLIGEVEYSAQKIPSFLTRYGATSFFQKRKRYSFESEWRSVRALRRFTNVHQPENGPAIYLSKFGPGCIAEIQILPECTVEMKLRTLVAVDCRYRHTRVNIYSRSSLR